MLLYCIKAATFQDLCTICTQYTLIYIHTYIFTALTFFYSFLDLAGQGFLWMNSIGTLHMYLYSTHLFR